MNEPRVFQVLNVLSILHISKMSFDRNGLRTLWDQQRIFRCILLLKIYFKSRTKSINMKDAILHATFFFQTHSIVYECVRKIKTKNDTIQSSNLYGCCNTAINYQDKRDYFERNFNDKKIQTNFVDDFSGNFTVVKRFKRKRIKHFVKNHVWVGFFPMSKHIFQMLWWLEWICVWSH